MLPPECTVSFQKLQGIPAETQASSFDGWTNLRRGSMTIVETDGSISKPAQHALTVDLTNHKLFVRNGGTALMTSDGFLQLDYKGVSFESKSINGVVVAYLLQCNADGTPYRRYGELSFVTTGAEVVGAVVQPSGLAPEEVGDPSVSMLPENTGFKSRRRDDFRGLPLAGSRGKAPCPNLFRNEHFEWAFFLSLPESGRRKRLLR